MDSAEASASSVTVTRVAEGRLQVLQIYRLLQSVHQNDKVNIEKMVKLGVENLINLTEPQHGTGALHVAAAANNQDLVGFLLSKGAQPNIQDKKGRTAIMLASDIGSIEIVTLLAVNNTDLKLRDAEGKGVLFYCAHPTERHSHCVQVALKYGADPNNVSSEGTHVFQLICEKVHECPPMCLSVLDGGADPNATNKSSGMTALMEAAKAGSVDLVRAILQKGANPNIWDLKRLTAVHYAATGGFFEVIRVLSAFSADMGIITLDDCTPLHYAAVTGSPECCKFLAQRGCNPKLKSLEGVLPRQIAKEGGHKPAVKELKKAEKQQGQRNKAGAENFTLEIRALTLHDWSNENEEALKQVFENPDEVSADAFLAGLEQLKAPIDQEQIHSIIAAHDRGGPDGINTDDFIKGAKYIKKPFLISTYMPKKKKGGKKGK